jgi:S-adenosylmethionine decarboxylase
MIEYVVDAHGCAPEKLRDAEALRALADRIVRELDLHVVGERWHQFPEPGGVTFLYLLRESHLAAHTYPETGLCTLNLFCCRPRPPWPWAERLREALGAHEVVVREVQRG